MNLLLEDALVFLNPLKNLKRINKKTIIKLVKNNFKSAEIQKLQINKLLKPIKNIYIIFLSHPINQNDQPLSFIKINFYEEIAFQKQLSKLFLKIFDYPTLFLLQGNRSWALSLDAKYLENESALNFSKRLLSRKIVSNIYANEHLETSQIINSINFYRQTTHTNSDFFEYLFYTITFFDICQIKSPRKVMIPYEVLEKILLIKKLTAKRIALTKKNQHEYNLEEQVLNNQEIMQINKQKRQYWEDLAKYDLSQKDFNF